MLCVYKMYIWFIHRFVNDVDHVCTINIYIHIHMYLVLCRNGSSFDHHCSSLWLALCLAPTWSLKSLRRLMTCCHGTAECPDTAPAIARKCRLKRSKTTLERVDLFRYNQNFQIEARNANPRWALHVCCTI